jgi:MFS transporter, ACS family, D-galactonate transporter
MKGPLAPLPPEALFAIIGLTRRRSRRRNGRVDMPTTNAGGSAWATVFFLFTFMLINFADKTIIGLAGVPIMQELQLTPSQFGIVGSSFFLLFSISAIVTGFIVNRVETRWALALMGLVWALTQLPMIGTIGLATLIACRIALGAGEGPAYPVALHSAYKWFPNEQRTLPTAIISQGAGVGVLIALPALNWVIVNYSWHWAFGVLGIVGLIWTALWLLFGREGPIAEASETVKQIGVDISYRELLASPTILASWCAFFGAYWGLSLAISWQAPYVINVLGFSQRDIGLLSALPWGFAVILVTSIGWYSQRLLSRGVSSRLARGILGGGCVALGGIVLLSLPFMPNTASRYIATMIGGSLPAVIYIFSPAIVGEITPVPKRGALLAIGNAFGTSAGIIAPYVMGNVIERAATPIEGYNTGFVICGLIMLVGGAIGMIFMRPERDGARLTRAGMPYPAPAE